MEKINEAIYDFAFRRIQSPSISQQPKLLSCYFELSYFRTNIDVIESPKKLGVVSSLGQKIDPESGENAPWRKKKSPLAENDFLKMILFWSQK